MEASNSQYLIPSGGADGKARVNIIKANDLVKSDLVGKSDTYALVKYSTQEYKTSTTKNSQNPQRDFPADFDVPDGGDNHKRLGFDVHYTSAINNVDLMLIE